MPKIADVVTKIFYFLLFVSYSQCNVEFDQRLFKKTILERLAKQDDKIRVRSCDSSAFIRCTPKLIWSFRKESAIWSILI